MVEPEQILSLHSHTKQLDARQKFTLLAYLYRLKRAGNDTIPTELAVQVRLALASTQCSRCVLSVNDVGKNTILEGKQRLHGPDIEAKLAEIKAAVTDQELDEVYGNPPQVVTLETLDDPAATMDFKRRFREMSHPIDLEHIRLRFEVILNVKDGGHSRRLGSVSKP